ncbi:MAG: site-specific DNA-methyltransferase [Lachnospiraceae bacterium]|nr:site-specific DNA-methyltransferase [Lachnospiraceae bacterium]
MIKDIVASNENVTQNSREIEVLRENFPSCFRPDSSFDIERFKEFLGDKVAVSQEGYELRFLGKSYSKMLAALDTETVIVPDEEHNSKPENKDSQNVYISGDNLDGLKHLLKSYAGEIKCIYIDPPYNTGTDGFVYNDRFNFTVPVLMEKLSITEEQALRILDLTSRGSAAHSAWLMFMYPRLQLARDLLSDDGAIFISIDDNEQANLKLICDDIFGEENCMGTIARATGQTTGQDSGGFGSSFDYAFVYGRKPELDIAGIPLNSHDLTRFDNEDERGWYAYDQLRKTGSDDRREDRPNMYYAIKDPDGNDLYPTATAGYDSRWRVERNTYDKLVEDGYIMWKKTTRNSQEVWWPYVKYYAEGRTKRPSPLWDDLEGNKKATRDVRALFDNVKVFDYVKPIAFIERIIQVAPNMKPDDIILDFFAGSATTAHAVMKWNSEHESHYRYIMVQLPAELDTSVSSQKVTYDYLRKIGRKGTLDEVGQERIIRAAMKVKEANPDSTIDFGFKHYTIKTVDELTLDKLEKFDNSSFVTNRTVYDLFGTSTILTTWLIHDGYTFTNKCQTIDLAGYTTFWCENHLYLLNPDMSEESIKALIDRYNSDGDFNPQNIVVFGYSFNYVNMENLKTNIKILRDSEKNLKVNLDLRY